MQYIDVFSAVEIKNFSRKCLIFFLFLLENIDCGGSNEYPQSIKNKKNRYTPAYPSFAIYTWGSRVYALHGHVFVMSSYIMSMQKHMKASYSSAFGLKYIKRSKYYDFIVFKAVGEFSNRNAYNS